jgi:hypothetical protein
MKLNIARDMNFFNSQYVRMNEYLCTAAVLNDWRKKEIEYSYIYLRVDQNEIFSVQLVK